MNSTTAKKPLKKTSQTTRGEANSAAAYLLVQLSYVIYQDDVTSFSYMYFFCIWSSPQPPPRWFKYQLNKRCQSRGPFRLGRRSPSSQNRWLQQCPWLMHKLPYKPRLLSYNPCSQLCSLWLNQPRSTSSQLPLQVRYRIATLADIDVLVCTCSDIQRVSH